MSDKPDGDRPVSRLKNATYRVPPVEVDCSDCDPDVPADPRPGSRLVNATRRVAAVVTDCSDWELAVWVEVRGARAAVVVAAAPALKLVHDPARSGADVVALAAADPAATREELAALIPAIRAALGPGVAADIRLCPAA